MAITMDNLATSDSVMDIKVLVPDLAKMRT